MLNADKNKLIFDLLQAALFQKDITLPNNIDWNQILQEMKIQTIAGLPYEWLCSRNVLDAKIKMYWNQIVVFQVSFWVKLMHEQELLIQLMRKNNINMVILKGAAAAIYYPRPDLRTMGDIDFLVNPKEFQKAYHILLENGYQLCDPEGDKDYHIAFKKNNVTFELHNTLPIIRSIKNAPFLQELIEDGLCHAEQKSIEQWNFPMLPRLQNGIILLLHIVQHIKRGLGLRQIVDWMIFVDKELNDEIWKSEFQPILQKIKLETFAITLTKMCQLYLGLKTENITWCHSADPLLCKELLNHFIEKGNFGRKAGKSGIVIYALSTEKKFSRFFKKLQRNGKNHWKLAKKHPILRPFAWLYLTCKYVQILRPFSWFYQTCKCIQHSSNKKHPLQLIKKEWKKIREKVQLFDALELFEK